ncbi:MAG: DUF5679 domain-containing protein [Anaerolineae bacterium]|nr:DUF5679 domain-containing protein [Anaerolineae bacterium]
MTLPEDAVPEHDDIVYEAYCMRCRDTIEVVDPHPIWTRRGQPALQGDCPVCGGTVFRLGKTDLHQNRERPSAIVVAEEHEKRKRPRLTRDTVYLAAAAADETAAQQIAADLGKAGLAVWLHDSEADTSVWSGGVHPALKECTRMVLVLSPAVPADAVLTAAWQFFRQQRKPIVLASVAPADPPDPIRRSPRFDFQADYWLALRQMLNALSR